MSELTLTLAQPAQIGDRARKDFLLSTLEYVPGAVVRGAFAAAWLARNGVSQPGTAQREEFLRLFEGGVRFGSLLRAGTEYMSLAVAGHKYEPGDGCEKVDWDQAMGEEPPPWCQQCHSPIGQLKGLHGTRTASRRRTSVAIGENGVAKDGELFTRELLQPGQAFGGTLVAPESLRDILAGLGPVRIGGRRTTHGLARVAITESGMPPGPQRRPDDEFLVIRLRSPGIFTDCYGRPSRVPSPAALRETLGVPARVVKSWTRWEQTGGWHIASGLPKQQELAVSAGSTFLIHPERTVPDSGLARLAERGLGLRRHEGFGDLAPPPALRPGKADRDAEARRLRRLANQAAPLNRLRARAQLWPALLTRAGEHASGNVKATEWLRQLADSPLDADVREAVAVFLDLPLADAAYVTEVLRR